MSEGAKNIMIVEDELELHEIIVFDFETAGYNPVEAERDNSALRLLAKTKVDAIVSDIRISDGDGIQLLRPLKSVEATRNLILALITAFADDEYV